METEILRNQQHLSPDWMMNQYDLIFSANQGALFIILFPSERFRYACSEGHDVGRRRVYRVEV